MYIIRIALAVYVLLLSIEVLAASERVATAKFTANTTKLDLSPYIEILPDPDHSLTIHDFSTGGKHLDSFRPVAVTGNSFGFSKSAYWVRFSLHIDKSLRDSLLLEFEYPLIDNLTLFVPDGQGGFSERITGDSLPFSSREVQYRNFLFRLPEHRDETRIYYLRLQTDGSMQIPFLLWTSSAFIEYLDRANYLLGIYYGIFLLLMLVALAYFLKLHDRLFLSYALYLFSYLLFQHSLNGFSFQLLWPELPWFTSRATAASVGFVVIGGLVFSGSFLQIWGNKHPRVKILFYILVTSGLVGMLMSLFGSNALAIKISTVSGLLLPPVVLIAAISSLLKGYRPARYFLIAWSIFLFGVFVAGLLHLGFVPHTFLTLYAMQIGSIFEVILLGYALMDRIELLRTEKEQATVQAGKYLNQLNEKLGILVDQRTQQLEEKNQQLSELAVRDSMTGMLNHNAAVEYLGLMQQVAGRCANDLAVIMLDIDHFKSINDKYGHPAGDRVIKAIADIIDATTRKSDGSGRYGGEEFILILPESDARQASTLAERIREKILQLRIPEINNIAVSASFGIAFFEHSNPASDLIAQADIALYKAKAAGRNQVMLCETISSQ